VQMPQESYEIERITGTLQPKLVLQLIIQF
jgi:hypothetical protein